MKMTAIQNTAEYEPAPICPNCGSPECEDNRINERLYALAAKEAPRLRFEGNTDEAIELLTALSAIRIANFIRHPWRCFGCGVTFDG